jgi:hypothetical protein
MKRITLKRANQIFWSLFGIGIAVGALGCVCRGSAVAMVGVLFLLGAIFSRFLFYRCPHCNRYLDRSDGGFCPCCGKKLDL